MRLSVFLNIPKKEIGIIGGGKKKPTGISNRDLCEEHTTNDLYDYLDSEIDTAMKMYGKRCKGYRSMGYEIIEK